MSATAQIPDLSTLRRFVTLADLDELAAHVDAAAAYFQTFSAEDDATLLIHAATTDAAWAEAVVRDVISAAGSTPEMCADVRLCLVDDADGIWLRFARRAHAVLGHGPADWILVRRPTYGWDRVGLLREYAVRRWGWRDTPAPYSYEDALAHVVARGWTTEHHARMGSVPEASLATILAALDTALPPAQPRLLHVGNFVGISLSYLLDWARTRNGLTVSVDPDIPHRGVAHPQRAVCDVLAHFGLAERHLLICGYSLDKCFSNDGVVFDGYDPAAAWAAEAAPENVLPGLVASGQRFDAAFIDGNHDAAYLQRELAEITDLLTPGGVLVLDDVDENWDQISRLFDEVSNGEWPYERILADGRVGILRRVGEDDSRNWTEGR
jgi:Methyltransferase domain